MGKKRRVRWLNGWLLSFYCCPARDLDLSRGEDMLRRVSTWVGLNGRKEFNLEINLVCRMESEGLV